MSENKHQVKLTREEIEAALIATAQKIILELNSYADLSETTLDRFNYLSKRLITIQVGKPEISENENQAAPVDEQPKPQTWS